MIIQEDLRVCSLLTIASVGGNISIVEEHDNSEFDWVVYAHISTSNKTGYSFTSKYLNSGFLEYLFGARDLVWDLEGKGYVNRYLRLSKVEAASYSVHPECKTLLGSDSAVDGFYTIPDGTSPLVTPFMGVGTQIPENIAATDLCSMVMLCKNPASVHVIVSGDLKGAKSVLGQGLEKIRGLYLDYLGIIPSSSSVPGDLPIPFIYTHFPTDTSLSAMAVVLSSPNKCSGKYSSQIKAAVSLSCLLYCIVEIDHGYRGFSVVGEGYRPREWCVTTSSSSTNVPFRYPCLVFLLSLISKYQEAAKYYTEQETHDQGLRKKVVLPEAFTKLSSNAPFSTLASVSKELPSNYPLYEQLPSLCKSFFIALYRMTCRGVLVLPSKKDFPRRSEASRDFVEVFERAEPLINLGGYLQLSSYLTQTAVLNSAGMDLHWSSAQLNITPHTLLLSGTVLPPLEITGSLDTLKGSRLLSYNHYLDRVSAWAGLKVVNEEGVTIDLAEGTEYLTLQNLAILKEQLSGADSYTYVDIDSVKKMCSGYGYSAENISPNTIDDDFLKKVVFSKGVLCGVNLKTLVCYHQAIGHEATALVLNRVCDLLTSLCMDSYTSLDKFSHNIDKLMLYVCVKDYLRGVLDSCRI